MLLKLLKRFLSKNPFCTTMDGIWVKKHLQCVVDGDEMVIETEAPFIREQINYIKEICYYELKNGSLNLKEDNICGQTVIILTQN